MSDIGNSLNTTNPARWFGRFSNGPVWNEYTCYYNNYTLINYAIEDSVTNHTIFNVFGNVPQKSPSIVDQIQNFTTTFKNAFNNRSIENDIAVIQLSLNDLSLYASLVKSNGLQDTNFVKKLVTSIYNSVNTLNSFGYKKIIVTDIPEIKYLPFKDMVDPQMVKIIQEMTPKINRLIFQTIVSYARSNRKDLDWIKTVSIDTMFQLSKKSSVTDALGITYSNIPCNNVSPTNVLISTCTDPDQYFFNDATSLSTKVHALIGAVFSQVINNTSFSYDPISIISLIPRFNITGAGSFNNFLYFANTSQTGMVNVSEYNFNSTLDSASNISNQKNSASISSLIFSNTFVYFTAFLSITVLLL
ncbi:hypothetical protein BB561_001047 [Smittium simulii]|uniref:Uncharacterized protein n=1 Tax=Smittium simulii TaxID=133385 RepID=A0A2T9YWE4_9FUNG|nr:hypothetical protein BB561_001047 [Smittium simulii]